MLETFLFALGIITGFTINALTNAGRFRKVEKTEEINKIEQLIEENRYLSDQVASCKNRLENIENKADIDHKVINKKLESIEFHITDDGQNFEAVKTDLEYLEDKFIDIERLMCRQTNNLKNCIVNKRRRR